MNLNKFGRWSGIVVAVAMLAMVLQGCGGDDNGADQDMRDQLAMLQGELDAANAAKMAAESAQTAAEAAQATAEMERDQANTAKTEALQAAEDAMAAQTAAETKANMYKAELDKLQGQIDTGEADEMSVAAKALLTKALVNAPIAAANAVTVKVADGELKPEVADYTLGDMPDMIEGWMGATLMDKDGNTIVVYSDRGALGGTMFLDVYTGDDSRRNEDVYH